MLIWGAFPNERALVSVHVNKWEMKDPVSDVCPSNQVYFLFFFNFYLNIQDWTRTFSWRAAVCVEAAPAHLLFLNLDVGFG